MHRSDVKWKGVGDAAAARMEPTSQNEGEGTMAAGGLDPTTDCDVVFVGRENRDARGVGGRRRITEVHHSSKMLYCSGLKRERWIVVLPAIPSPRQS